MRFKHACVAAAYRYVAIDGFAARLEAIGVAVQVEEHVLDDVAGVVVVAQHPAGAAQHGVAVLLVDLLERHPAGFPRCATR